jgi:hypothetical protein
MARSGSRGTGDEKSTRPATRSRLGDPLVRQVQWRLFRREDLPARMRRLQRLEDLAFPQAEESPAAPDASRNGRLDAPSDEPDPGL